MKTGHYPRRRTVVALLAWLLAAPNAHAATLTVEVVDADGTPLENAVIELYDPAGSTVPAAQGEIEQRDHAFAPHVLALPTGTAVAFPNHDDTRHHVYSFSPAKTFELKLYLDDPQPPVIFDTPGVVVLGCNIHDHMQGFVVIGDASHRAVTDASGRISFDGLTSQPMRMSVWHPRLSSDHQQRQESVLTPAGQAETVALTLTVPPRSERTRSSLQQLFDRATE